MKRTLLILATGAALGAGAAAAQSGADVLKAKGCLNCHDMTQKKVGPSFKDVAAKYAADKGAAARIEARLKEGKTHPKAAASDAELKAAVGYALSTK